MIYLLPKNALQDYLELSSQKKHLIASVALARSNESAYEQANSGIQNDLQRETIDWPCIAVFQLLQQVEIAVHLGEADEYDWLLLNQVREVTRNFKFCASLKEKGAWLSALNHAAQAINNAHYRHSLNYADREALVARELSGLEGEKIKYDLNMQGGYLPQKDFKKLCLKIEKKIISVGGEQSANLLLNLAQRSGRVLDESLLHARVTTSWQGKQRVGTPWHYIYSLCLKHLDKPPKSKNVKQDLEKMENLAMAMAASLNIESHSAYEHISVDVHSSLYVLQETLLYDELWAFPQWQPSAAKYLVKKWIDALLKEGVILPHYSQTIWDEIVDKIYTISHPYIIATG